jgi:hypothetical protein
MYATKIVVLLYFGLTSCFDFLLPAAYIQPLVVIGFQSSYKKQSTQNVNVVVTFLFGISWSIRLADSVRTLLFRLHCHTICVYRFNFLHKTAIFELIPLYAISSIVHACHYNLRVKHSWSHWTLLADIKTIVSIKFTFKLAIAIVNVIIMVIDIYLNRLLI